VALWLLAALFGVIGLLIVGQLLARLSFLEAAEYGTVPLAALALVAAGWLAAAAVIAVLPGEAATRNAAARVLRSE